MRTSSKVAISTQISKTAGKENYFVLNDGSFTFETLPTFTFSDAAKAWRKSSDVTILKLLPFHHCPMRWKTGWHTFQRLLPINIVQGQCARALCPILSPNGHKLYKPWPLMHCWIKEEESPLNFRFILLISVLGQKRLFLLLMQTYCKRH